MNGVTGKIERYNPLVISTATILFCLSKTFILLYLRKIRLMIV